MAFGAAAHVGQSAGPGGCVDAVTVVGHLQGEDVMPAVLAVELMTEIFGVQGIPNLVHADRGTR